MHDEKSAEAPTQAQRELKNAAYWRANLRLLAFCLAIWFVVSFGFGILLVDELNRFRVMGFQLGFWFAQQGSIYVFLLLIFFYAWAINRLDHRFGVQEREDDH